MLLAIIVILGVGGGLLTLLFKLLKRPIKWAFKLLLHVVSGFIFLGIFNFVGARVGLSIAVNWVSALISGVLGIPGVILLLVIKYIL